MPLSELEIYENGIKIDISSESIEWWKLTGLNHIDFIIHEGWKDLDALNNEFWLEPKNKITNT